MIGSLYVDEAYRGNGYGNILVKGLILCIDYQYQDVFEYIRHDNVSSIKVAHKNGFNKVNNAEYSGILRTVKINPDGHLGVYRKVKNN